MKTKEIEANKNIQINDLLTGKQINEIVTKWLKERNEDKDYVILKSEVRRACEGISGFLGDHFKVAIHLDKGVIRLFIKNVPINNKSKEEFIHQGEFYHREMTVYKIFDDLRNENDKKWNPKTYICNENVVVMPDLSIEGYKTRPAYLSFDFDHAKTALTALAHFHATTVNYQSETNKYSPQEYEKIFTEQLFREEEPDLMRSTIDVTVAILKTFTRKEHLLVDNLRDKIKQIFVETSKLLRYHENTINCVIHKDLWANNILFKYEDEVPIKAILVDYQLARYAPPAFDVMSLLQIATKQKFRNQHEKTLLEIYYNAFYEALTQKSRNLVENLGYDKENFFHWCERARVFSSLFSIVTTPFSLMDPNNSEKYFHNADTFGDMVQDRTSVIVQYAKDYELFRETNLSLIEDFVEKYVLTMH